MNDISQLVTDLEAFETPKWCVDAILEKELLTDVIWDPCCGTGVIAEAVLAQDTPGHGKWVFTTDIHDWGYPTDDLKQRGFGDADLDFLSYQIPEPDVDPGGYNPENFPSTPRFKLTIFMNPPFSKAEAFVEKAHEIGARKIICFQRFSWWEAAKRRDFWAKYPPNRIYICGNRATCWRFDIPEEERGSGTTTAHAWFIWEQGHPPGTLVGHIWKERND